MHSLSEIRRLSPIDYESILQNDVYTHQYSTNKNLLVLFGHSGSGILTFSNNFTHQLESVMADTQIVHSIMDCSNVTDVLDIKSFCDQVPATTSNSNTVLLISVIISARQCVMLPDLLQLLEISINCKASVVISLLSPASLKIGSAIAEK